MDTPPDVRKRFKQFSLDFGVLVDLSLFLWWTEKDGQRRVQRSSELRHRRQVNVLQLLQVQPSGPRGGGHGPQAAGTYDPAAPQT